MNITTRHRRRRGFSMLELAIASLILGILSVGSLGYQYYASRDARRAEVQTTASRLAKMMLDQWKGMGGDTTYNPISSLSPEVTIIASERGPAAASVEGVPFTKLGSYRIQVDTRYYYATCSWRAASATEPILLNVAVAWRNDYKDGVLDDTSPEVRYSVFYGL